MKLSITLPSHSLVNMPPQKQQKSDLPVDEEPVKKKKKKKKRMILRDPSMKSKLEVDMKRAANVTEHDQYSEEG